jgi:aryl-alcohol dehydrogenase-like predicted oxidoreductase
VEYRRLGASGLAVSEIAHGNWLTHSRDGCVEAALDAGVTTFHTAAAWAGGAAEAAYGKAFAATTSCCAPASSGRKARARTTPG